MVGSSSNEAEQVSKEVVERNRITILIVPRPDDWTPSSPVDLPPEFEQHFEDSTEAAAAFVHGFNAAEMVESKGMWAIA